MNFNRTTFHSFTFALPMVALVAGLDLAAPAQAADPLINSQAINASAINVTGISQSGTNPSATTAAQSAATSAAAVPGASAPAGSVARASTDLPPDAAGATLLAAADGASNAAEDAPRVDPREVECVAKVIVHEAGNQSHRGQVAVAQVVRARIGTPAFGTSACAVIRQPRQFFNIDHYHPDRTSTQWREAMVIAHDALAGVMANPVPGALYFHNRHRRMHGHVELARIEDHIFYR